MKTNYVVFCFGEIHNWCELFCFPLLALVGESKSLLKDYK